MKKLILYDLDGTLADTKTDIAAAANAMLREFGAAALPVEQVSRFVGSGLQELVKGCLKTDAPEKVERGVSLYRAYYREHLLDHTVLYPSARELLDHFRDRSQAVVTNKPNPYSKEIIAGLGVAGYFLDVVGGESEYGKKPKPAAVQAIMRRVGASAAETVLIGDSPVDVETGRNAGIFTACVSHGYASEAQLRACSPDLLIPDLGRLLERARSDRW